MIFVLLVIFSCTWRNGDGLTTFYSLNHLQKKRIVTVDPMGAAQLQWNLDNTKGQGTDSILFTIRFSYIEVLFHIFYYYWGKKKKGKNKKNVRYSEDIQELPFFRLKST